MKNLSITLGLAILFIGLMACKSLGPITDKPTDNQWIEGTWIGLGYQPDAANHNTWDIQIKIEEGGKKAAVLYPSLKCGGELELISIDNHKAVFTERIIEGKQYCYDGGQLVLTYVNQNHVSYSFFYPDTKALGSFSTLTKDGFQPDKAGKRL